MALVKNVIHMNKMKGKVVSQITLDDDVIVPDRLPDINNKITEDGNIVIDSVKVAQNKIMFAGKLKFKMMYKAMGDNVEIHKLDGVMDFDESLNMEGLEEGDTINIDFVIDDLSIHVINSRKISVKAVITVIAMAETTQEEQVAVDVDDEEMEYIMDTIDVSQVALRKKDLLRIKEEIDLGAGKLNIGEIIWHTASLFNPLTKVMQDKVNISGEIMIFVLYTSDDGPIQWVDASVPFNGMVEVPGCFEDMIPCIEIKLSNAEIEAKPDYDGEQRMLQLDGIVNVDIKLYEEQHMNILKDIYSRKKDVTAITKKVEYENLLMKNMSKCRAVDKIKVNLENTHIMQICSCSGDPKIDDITVEDDGLLVEGAVDVSVLYICSDDYNPLCCVTLSVPFSQKIEIENINSNSVYKVKSMIDQIQATMIGSDEIEVKVVVCLDAIVFNIIEKEVICDIEEKEYDLEKIASMPGIVAYVVQKGDTLWSIAKKFHTTVESLKNINELKNGEFVPGEMIVVVKKMDL